MEHIQEIHLGRWRSYDSSAHRRATDDDAKHTLDHGLFADDYVAPHCERLHVLNLRNREAWKPTTTKGTR